MGAISGPTRQRPGRRPLCDGCAYTASHALLVLLAVERGPLRRFAVVRAGFGAPCGNERVNCLRVLTPACDADLRFSLAIRCSSAVSGDLLAITIRCKSRAHASERPADALAQPAHVIRADTGAGSTQQSANVPAMIARRNIVAPPLRDPEAIRIHNTLKPGERQPRRERTAGVGTRCRPTSTGGRRRDWTARRSPAMTRTTNARVTGVRFFVYLAAGFGMMLMAGCIEDHCRQLRQLPAI
jgi:hypothetical protein